MDDLVEVPVAVVGGGPVGLVLALLLDSYGVPCVVIEAEEGTNPQPRGNTHNARTMEHYRRLGVADRIRELGLPADHPTDVAYFTRYNGYELARLPMPSAAAKAESVATAPNTDQIPEPLHRANQVYVERFLLDLARTRPNITVRTGWRVEGVWQDDTGVVLQAERTSDGLGETWRADYAVGCDGGRSTVRSAIGGGYVGSGPIEQEILGGRATATHLRLPTLYRDFLGGRRAWSYWALNHELAVNLISLDGAAEFSLLTSSVDHIDEVAGLVRRAVGADVPVEVLGHRPWTPGLALVADRFGAGRVFLAGDSAHLFTPTGGFGMNTGIDDVANLSWKLAAVLRGWADPALLDSYEAERRQIAERNTEAARRLNSNLGAIERTRLLEEDSVEGRQARARTGALLSGYGEQFASIGVQLGARYDNSPIIVGEGTAPPDSATSYTPSSVPGGRAPHLWLGAGRGRGDSLFDRLGTWFTVLRLGPNPPDATDLVLAARARRIPLRVLEIPDPSARELYERSLVLIRPDQHVAWRGDRPPADAAALLARLVHSSRGTTDVERHVADLRGGTGAARTVGAGTPVRERR